jgi:hypothetical protein
MLTDLSCGDVLFKRNEYSDLSSTYSKEESVMKGLGIFFIEEKIQEQWLQYIKKVEDYGILKRINQFKPKGSTQRP